MGVLVRVVLATKMADAQVEYKRVDLRSYEARNGASFAQSFKYKFSFPSIEINAKSQCYERKQIRSESRQCTGGQNGAETLGKLTCAARSAMVP